MEITATYIQGARFDITARGHQIICDQPTENGGADSGLSPPELLLASLASCAGYYASQYLGTRGLSREGLQVRVTAEKGMRPVRLISFRIEVQVAELSDSHREGTLRAVKTCLIHNTLAGGSSIEIVIVTRSLLAK